MPEGLYLRDSGELSAAAALLGVAHETGFPLYCLLGRLLSLLPVGEIATRVTTLSALSGAAGASLLAVLARRLIGRPVAGEAAGLAAAALLLSSTTCVKAAAVAEVYAPTGALIVLIMLVLHHDEEGRARPLLLGVLLVSLGVSLHSSLRLLAPALLTCLLGRLARGERSPLLAAPIALLGLLPALYLPLRAARGTLVSFGDPSSAAGLHAHLFAARIREAFADQMMSLDPALILHHGGLFFKMMISHFWPFIVLGPAGLWLLFRESKRAQSRGTRAVALCAACLLVLDPIYAVWVNPMGLSDLQNGVPTQVGLALCAAYALGRLAVFLIDRIGLRGRLVLPALLALVLPALLTDPEVKLGLSGSAPALLPRAALAQIPPRGLLLSTSDDLSATLLYEQGVAAARPDVTILVRQMAWDGAYVRRMTALTGVWLSTAEARSFAAMHETARVRGAEALIRRMAARAPGRVGWEPSPEDAPPFAARPGVPLFLLSENKAGPGPLPDPLPLIGSLDGLLRGPEGVPADPVLRGMGARYLLRLAEAYYHGGDDRAGLLADLALALSPGFAAARVMRGVLLSRAGDMRGALREVERVLAEDPTHKVAHINAGRYLLRLGDRNGAARHARQVLRQDPRHLGARRLLERSGLP